MIYPPVDELCKNGCNRYILCIATSKCARKITEKYAPPANAKNSDEIVKSHHAILEEKPLVTAINKLYNNEYRIVIPDINV
ncbi:hypothetical protein SDC9_185782 [bioreactor metagenome]|uniref:DNA-directed RNA polymerase n=1 Tax=bioreactor metagenome TaxID=1076179 RepID=A0A645HGU0_9ZZZZ|nr:DNA-directed RNA polymerase subunit omega [Oscillospiraceae bacterium]